MAFTPRQAPDYQGAATQMSKDIGSSEMMTYAHYKRQRDEKREDARIQKKKDDRDYVMKSLMQGIGYGRMDERNRVLDAQSDRDFGLRKTELQQQQATNISKTQSEMNAPYRAELKQKQSEHAAYVKDYQLEKDLNSGLPPAKTFDAWMRDPQNKMRAKHVSIEEARRFYNDPQGYTGATSNDGMGVDGKPESKLMSFFQGFDETAERDETGELIGEDELEMQSEALHEEAIARKANEGTLVGEDESLGISEQAYEGDLTREHKPSPYQLQKQQTQIEENLSAESFQDKPRSREKEADLMSMRDRTAFTPEEEAAYNKANEAEAEKEAAEQQRQLEIQKQNKEAEIKKQRERRDKAEAVKAAAKAEAKAERDRAALKSRKEGKEWAETGKQSVAANMQERKERERKAAARAERVRLDEEAALESGQEDDEDAEPDSALRRFGSALGLAKTSEEKTQDKIEQAKQEVAAEKAKAKLLKRQKEVQKFQGERDTSAKAAKKLAEKKATKAKEEEIRVQKSAFKANIQEGKIEQSIKVSKAAEDQKKFENKRTSAFVKKFGMGGGYDSISPEVHKRVVNKKAESIPSLTELVKSKPHRLKFDENGELTPKSLRKLPALIKEDHKIWNRLSKDAKAKVIQAMEKSIKPKSAIDTFGGKLERLNRKIQQRAQ